MKPKVNAVIQTRSNTLVLDFPRSLTDLHIALLRSGIPEHPRDIYLMDNEGDPIRAKVYGENELGKHLARIFKTHIFFINPSEYNSCIHTAADCRFFKK